MSNSIANRIILISGGFVRWLLSSWKTKKKLKEYFEDGKGEMDKQQCKYNYTIGIILYIILLLILYEFFKPEEEQWREFDSPN